MQSTQLMIDLGFDFNEIYYAYGDDGNDTLYGYAGDDDLQGEGGDDILYGGPGKDRLIGYVAKCAYVAAVSLLVDFLPCPFLRDCRLSG